MGIMIEKFIVVFRIQCKVIDIFKRVLDIFDYLLSGFLQFIIHSKKFFLDSYIFPFIRLPFNLDFIPMGIKLLNIIQLRLQLFYYQQF